MNLKYVSFPTPTDPGQVRYKHGEYNPHLAKQLIDGLFALAIVIVSALLPMASISSINMIQNPKLGDASTYALPRANNDRTLCAPTHAYISINSLALAQIKRNARACFSSHCLAQSRSAGQQDALGNPRPQSNKPGWVLDEKDNFHKLCFGGIENGDVGKGSRYHHRLPSH